MAEYGFDLVGEWETVGCRRLWVLIQGLPMSAAVWREENKWTQQDELAAALVELTDISSRRVVAALGGEVRGEPLRIERPGGKAPGKERIETTDTQQIMAWFQRYS